ncbi:CMGC/DYRK/DYRK2 protein kinase [Kwoniella heveanensis BCC8398]|uniref:CMGC/DYRK/DYRK2 protein kinase n=1 Tax=Kwoniella heveanensis BCC8398 TaxID=1296120 RepID=A0A1B9GT05_9TREE|nr:CMGC/DYRK/DYRK2 protein kinase [Kwoniella heveanensis BCC8398]
MAATMDQPHDPGPSSSRPTRQESQGYPDYVLQPAYTPWSAPLSPPHYGNSAAPSSQLLPTPPRERLASSTSTSSLSSTMRGRRAPAPAALDLSPRKEDRYAGLGVRPTAENRRVVTEPVRHRPLPHPPTTTTTTSMLAPSAFTTPIIPQIPTSDTRHSSISIDSYYHSNNNPSVSPLGVSPEQPDPSNIDRRALIGVGELATPRWGASNQHQHMRTPSMPFSLEAMGSLPTTSEQNWSQSQEGVGLGIDNGSLARTPPRPPTKSPARSTSSTAKREEPYSFGDFHFDSSMEAAIAATLAMPSEPKEKPISTASPASSISPGSARSRIYARRQERADAAAANQPPQPLSADSQTFAHRAGRDSRKTPPNPARHSSGDILKQFAVKDFSHLPPSPSTASINQFLKGSGSTHNFSSTPPASASNSQFSASKLQRSDSQKLRSVASNPKMDEALRKLDGLGGTPGRKRNKTSTSASTVASRPGTPSKSVKKLPSRQSNGSLNDSPLNTWVDIGDELPAVPTRRKDKRESSSSTSFIGTPTSRDSLPTTSTTPSSGDGHKARRVSGGSDVSTPSITVIDQQEDDIPVPPVPPLPKGYVSMRQGLNTANLPPVGEPSAPAQSTNMQSPSLQSPPMQASQLHPHPMHSPQVRSPPVQSPPESTSPLTAPPRMNKKWSFSSALNLKMHSPAEEEPPHSPQTPWSEIQRNELPSPGLHRHESSESHISVPKSQAKRLTPSSIPFFRRTSSSSTQSKTTVPETPKQTEPRPAPGSQSRKSVLGMHLPSMLRGSTSKRGLSQQLAPAPQPPKTEKAETTGWTGRKRGKTLSISADPSKPFIPESLKHKSSVESSLRSSAASNRSESTVNGHDSRLPAIVGSPAKPELRSSNSSRELPSATPTKIPRMAARPDASSPGMPPPAMPSLRHKTTSSSMADLTRAAPISEFGVVEGMATPRQSTSGAHRAHLLAPMSARQSSTRYRPSDPPVRREPPVTAVPPSRRTLPQPPSSSVTAMTVSANAKRASRDLGPGPKRRVSNDTLQGGSSGRSSPIKPSKSLHSKLSVPNTSRMSSSSSVGAPGTSYRKTSLVVDTPSSSPAEDEDSLADAEMAAYIKRRRQRAAAGKKDDMADVNEFPEDIEPSEPKSQRAFMSQYVSMMADVERKELFDVSEVYYSPLPKKITRPVQPGGAVYNHGYDDERGDYIVVEGDHLCFRYEVVGVLGKGSFGQVVQCRDHKTGGSVAVKIIRNKKRFHTQALVEVKILEQLVEWDPEDKHFMVRMTDSFSFRGHLCIVTELLSINLYELIKANQFAGFSTVLIRRFTTQMLASLQLMRSHRIVHCDLKPENILLCHPQKSGIKVIDFGSSCLETEKVYTYIQSRFYRSPEVILGMNYAMAIDMWSLGCILAELYTGVPIFPGENEHEQLACIMEVLGLPDRYIVEKASRRKTFFDATGTPRPFVNAKGRRRRPGTKTLAGVLKCDDDLFVDFIAKCLTWDPDKRLKPQPAMRHPWILAGRKRYAPSRQESSRPDSRSMLPSLGGGHTSSGSSGSLLHKSSAGSKGDYKSKLLISPPTPLMARAPGSSLGAGSVSGSGLSGVAQSAPRVGPTSRLTHQTRNSFTVSGAEILNVL